MLSNFLRNLTVVLAASFVVSAQAQTPAAAIPETPQATAPATPTTTGAKPAKEVLLPAHIERVPDGNDFNNPDSEYCYKHSKASDNFVLFWDKEYGDDPMANPVANRRFNVDEILKEADRFYNFYIDNLKWVDRDKSYATKYKFLFIVIGGSGGTAFGGSVDNKIGAFWTPATRINKGPYGVVAHELGHSFQALGRADGGGSFTGGGQIAEMTSQYMLWQVYPEWMNFENYHLTAFMKATNLAFMHEDNQYHSPYVLEYWSNKHGQDFIGKLWHDAQRGEDPIMTYKRITNISQEQFNDEMFDACRRFVTWDMPRIEKVAARYDDQHTTTINHATDDWLQIATDKCPQNYGYNAIKLVVPAADTKVSLDFKGIAGAEGFSQTQLDKAGWRYGFLAHKEDGSRLYSDTFSKSEGTADFTVPANTKYLWLVVMGAPTEHWIHTSPRRRRGADATAAAPPASEQWPYQFKLTGTTVDPSVIQ
jgi:hypothetical protein